VESLPLSPRIGIFPFFSSDFDLLSKPNYSVREAQAVRQVARAKRFSEGLGDQGELYPDWEQAVNRRRAKLHSLTLPASSFLSIDRINEDGDVKQGNRPIIGRFAPRGEPRPQLLVPAKAASTRDLIRAFSTLDLIIVNIQNVKGKHLSTLITNFLREMPCKVPMLIIASSPADLIFTGALQPPSERLAILDNQVRTLVWKTILVNKDRTLAERQFCTAIEGLCDKSEVMARVVSQAKRTWWATRQSISRGPPYESVAFASMHVDMMNRAKGWELELLEEAKRLILKDAENKDMRGERRESVIRASLHNANPGATLVLVRSDSAADELRSIFATYLDVGAEELRELGVEVVNVFGPLPTKTSNNCVAAGYFGTSTIDMACASGASNCVAIVDPIEARVAIWEIEQRFASVRDLPEPIMSMLKSLISQLEKIASPNATPIALSMTAVDWAGSAGAKAYATAGKAMYVSLSLTDGSVEQTTANARFEVLGRTRLSLKCCSQRLAGGRSNRSSQQ
jgi:hypothetical protein